LSPEALEVARAVAILGPDAEVRHVAALSDLDVDTAATTADSLLQSEILGPDRPLAFVHPLVAAAIYNDLLPGERSRRHRAAARLLAAAGAPADRVAAQLMPTEPAGDPWVVEVMRDVGRVAMAHGATDVAIAHLRRALAEPPADRFETVAELGIAESLISDPQAIEHLEETLSYIDDLEATYLAQLGLAMALVVAGRPKEAAECMEQLIERATGSRVEADVRAGAALIGFTGPAAAEYLRERIVELRQQPPDKGQSAMVMGIRAYAGAMANEPLDAMVELARESLARLSLDDPTLPLWFHLPVTVLVIGDRREEAAQAIEAGLTLARRIGAPSHQAVSLHLRSWLAYMSGELEDARTDALAAVEILQLHNVAFVMPGPVGILVEVHNERNEIDEAEALLERFGLSEDDGPSMFHIQLCFSRARLRAARSEWDRVWADIELGSSLAARTECVSPGLANYGALRAMITWMSGGDIARARSLATESLAEARAVGSARVEANAKMVLGMTGPPDERALAHEALGLFADLGAKAAEAWSAYALGTSCRLMGEKEQARDLLERAAELAERCGAVRAAAWSRRDLAAMGVKASRRRPATGVAALTPSELRVVKIAAAGRTNKQVAQELYLTVKTVETHMAHAFQKLQISSRSELAAALAV
jgi:DNA-binding CsgD family transcriptional regulator